MLQKSNLVSQVKSNYNIQSLHYNTNEMRQSFGKWLLSARKAADMTQAEVAQKAGLSKAYIGHLENSRRHTTTGAELSPSRDKVVSLARAVGGSVNDALEAAGYASERRLPDFLYRIDWQKFSPTALNEIKSFIEFKATYEALPLIKNGEVLQEDGELFVEFSEEEVLSLIAEEEKLHHKN
jgi:transcriptional regulator with XRE-family HTH domain